jgi:hypothetical protein
LLAMQIRQVNAPWCAEPLELAGMVLVLGGG